MPRKRPATPESTELKRYDEANVARLGLISIQERVPVGHNTWAIEFVVDGRPARLSCDALPRHGGVPHGLDNDISLALITLYLEAGSPDNGTFDTSAYQVLKVTGLDTSGYYYKALKESLDRLSTATYTASEAWRAGGRWTTVRFRYIERLEYTSDNDRLNLSGGSVLRLTLAQEIVKSVRAQYIKPLNLQFLASLERPLTRALYRLLDAQRYQPDAEHDPATTYHVNIIEWADACKIVDKKPAKIRRTLEGAHAELIERGYLRRVDYDGRGEKQSVRYEFTRQTTLKVADPELVGKLVRHGVAPGVARKLVDEYGQARITERITKFDAIVASGYQARSKAALLVDIIRDDQEKYADPQGFVSQDRRAELEVQRAEQTRGLEAKIAEEDQQRERAWRQLPLEDQAEEALKTVSALFGRRLSTSTLAALRSAIVNGELDAADLVKRTTQAAMNMQLQDLS